MAKTTKQPSESNDCAARLLLKCVRCDPADAIVAFANGDNLRNFGDRDVVPRMPRLVLADFSCNGFNSLDMWNIFPDLWWLDVSSNALNSKSLRGLPKVIGKLNITNNPCCSGAGGGGGAEKQLPPETVKNLNHVFALRLKWGTEIPYSDVLEQFPHVIVLNDNFVRHCDRKRSLYDSLGGNERLLGGFGAKQQQGTHAPAGNWSTIIPAVRETNFFRAVQTMPPNRRRADCFLSDMVLEDYLEEARLSNTYIAENALQNARRLPTVNVQSVVHLPHRVRNDLAVLLTATVLFPGLPRQVLLDALIVLLLPRMSLDEAVDMIALPLFVKSALVSVIKRTAEKELAELHEVGRLHAKPRCDMKELLATAHAQTVKAALLDRTQLGDPHSRTPVLTPTCLDEDGFYFLRSFKRYLRKVFVGGAEEEVRDAVDEGQFDDSYSPLEMEILANVPDVPTAMDRLDYAKENEAHGGKPVKTGGVQYNEWISFVARHATLLMTKSPACPSLVRGQNSAAKQDAYCAMLPMLTCAKMTYADMEINGVGAGKDGRASSPKMRQKRKNKTGKDRFSLTMGGNVLAFGRGIPDGDPEALFWNTPEFAELRRQQHQLSLLEKSTQNSPRADDKAADAGAGSSPSAGGAAVVEVPLPPMDDDDLTRVTSYTQTSYVQVLQVGDAGLGGAEGEGEEEGDATAAGMQMRASMRPSTSNDMAEEIINRLSAPPSLPEPTEVSRGPLDATSAATNSGSRKAPKGSPTKSGSVPVQPSAHDFDPVSAEVQQVSGSFRSGSADGEDGIVAVSVFSAESRDRSRPTSRPRKGRPQAQAQAHRQGQGPGQGSVSPKAHSKSVPGIIAFSNDSAPSSCFMLASRSTAQECNVSMRAQAQAEAHGRPKSPAHSSVDPGTLSGPVWDYLEHAPVQVMPAATAKYETDAKALLGTYTRLQDRRDKEVALMINTQMASTAKSAGATRPRPQYDSNAAAEATRLLLAEMGTLRNVRTLNRSKKASAPDPDLVASMTKRELERMARERREQAEASRLMELSVHDDFDPDTGRRQRPSQRQQRQQQPEPEPEPERSLPRVVAGQSVDVAAPSCEKSASTSELVRGGAAFGEAAEQQQRSKSTPKIDAGALKFSWQGPFAHYVDPSAPQKSGGGDHASVTFLTGTDAEAHAGETQPDTTEGAGAGDGGGEQDNGNGAALTEEQQYERDATIAMLLAASSGAATSRSLHGALSQAVPVSAERVLQGQLGYGYLEVNQDVEAAPITTTGAVVGGGSWYPKYNKVSYTLDNRIVESTFEKSVSALSHTLLAAMEQSDSMLLQASTAAGSHVLRGQQTVSTAADSNVDPGAGTGTVAGAAKMMRKAISSLNFQPPQQSGPGAGTSSAVEAKAQRGPRVGVRKGGSAGRPKSRDGKQAQAPSQPTPPAPVPMIIPRAEIGSFSMGALERERAAKAEIVRRKEAAAAKRGAKSPRTGRHRALPPLTVAQAGGNCDNFESSPGAYEMAAMSDSARGVLTGSGYRTASPLEMARLPVVSVPVPPTAGRSGDGDGNAGGTNDFTTVTEVSPTLQEFLKPPNSGAEGNLWRRPSGDSLLTPPAVMMGAPVTSPSASETHQQQQRRRVVSPPEAADAQPVPCRGSIMPLSRANPGMVAAGANSKLQQNPATFVQEHSTAVRQRYSMKRSGGGRGSSPDGEGSRHSGGQLDKSRDRDNQSHDGSFAGVSTLGDGMSVADVASTGADAAGAGAAGVRDVQMTDDLDSSVVSLCGDGDGAKIEIV